MNAGTRVVALVLWIITASALLAPIHGVLVEEDIYIQDEPSVTAFTNPGASDTWVTRIVPIELDRSTNSDERLWNNVQAAMKNLWDRIEFCVRFIARKEEHVDYISVTGYTNQGCYSAIGRRGGKQIINIDQTCMSEGIIQHELMHALGFWHEQSRPDRDNHVSVLYGNIRPEKMDQFNKRYDSADMAKVIPYDYGSILHYKYDQFARLPGLDTILPKDNPKIDKTILGQRDRLSDYDVLKVFWLYKCGRFKIDGCRPPDSKVRVYPRKSTYAVGENITYSCPFGYFLYGPPYSLCKANGRWSGAIPFCFSSYRSAYLYTLDFERSFVDNFRRVWTVLQNSVYQARFQINTGQTAAKDSGPHTDHTHQLSIGHYLYLDATGVAVGAKTLFLSPLLRHDGSNDFCILFFYNMYGDGMGELSLTYCRYFACNVRWSKRQSTPDNQWYMEMVKLDIARAYYGRVKIEATRGSNDNSDIAIDDILMGPCSDVATYYTVVNRSAAYDETVKHEDFFTYYGSKN